MTGDRIIEIKIGVPRVGAPSVYQVKVIDIDSAGSVERDPRGNEWSIIAAGLSSYLAHLHT